MALIQITYRKGSPMDVKTLVIHDAELAALKRFDLESGQTLRETDLLEELGQGGQAALQRLVERGLLSYSRGPDSKMRYAPLVRTLITYEKDTIVPPPKKEEDSYTPRRWW